MNIKQMHIEIEQGLQNLGVFAYLDQSHEAIDIAIDTCSYQLIEDIFGNEKYEDKQVEADVIRVIKKEITLSPFSFTGGVQIRLPDDYVHLIADYSKVFLKTCFVKTVEYPSLLTVGTLYRTVGNVRIGEDTWFDDGVIFRATGSGFYGKVKEVSEKEVSNRLTDSENINYVLDNTYSKTQKNSPVSELIGGFLRVYTKDFDINAVRIVYCRKPVKSVYPNVDCEFPENVQKFLIEATVKRLAILSEQNQQKINNLQ